MKTKYKKEQVWIRIAANSPAWEKENGSSARVGEKTGLWWRCFVEPDEEPIYLKDFRLAGLAGGGNMATHAQPEADRCGVRAFIHVFGDITVDEHAVALVVFRDPNVEFKIHDPEPKAKRRK